MTQVLLWRFEAQQSRRRVWRWNKIVFFYPTTGGVLITHVLSCLPSSPLPLDHWYKCLPKIFLQFHH
jgi:hypothetical protein